MRLRYECAVTPTIGPMEPGKHAGPAETPAVDFESVCLRIRAAIEPARAHAVSLHDARGDLLWLSESSMGPDEHDAVRRALEAFADPAAPGVMTFDLGDARSAAVVRIADDRRATRGAALLILDTRILKALFGGVGLEAPRKLRDALSLVAVPARAAIDPGAPVAPAAPAAAGARAKPEPPSPELDRLHAALRRTPIALHVQRLVPLAKGTEFKRYEVLLRFRTEAAPNCAPQAMLQAAVEHGLGSMIDRRVVTELVSWLVRNPSAWRDPGALFSVNLTKTALHDQHFIKFVELCLSKAALPKGTIAFEISVPTAVKARANVAQIAAALHGLGCPVVLDDFGLRTECFDLLRLPGVQLIKLTQAITARMRTDKVSQASVTALVQMARVLGMHTVAKGVESATDQEWLNALGVDFVQSQSIARPVPIETLAGRA